MDRIVWIGPQPSADEYGVMLGNREVRIVAFASAEAAASFLCEGQIGVVVVAADWTEAASAIQKLKAAHPEVQILAATKAGVPSHLDLALQAGACGLVDILARGRLIERIGCATEHYERVVRERKLLLRLRLLNEEFLKNMISLEKRSIDLEGKVEPEQQTWLREQGNDKPYRVLVVDDEPAIKYLFELILEGEEYEVVTADDGQGGLDAFFERPFPLVITDNKMPGIGGLEVLRRIKRAQPDTDVIMITGYGTKEAAIEALNLGVSAFLEKPFVDIHKVRADIETVIHSQQERIQKRQYLHRFKERNALFLERYCAVRADLESWLGSRGVVDGRAGNGKDLGE